MLAITVAVGHSGLSPWHWTGNYSVQIFFALSGWLIGGILLQSAPRQLPRFYFNRAARIWIPYFLAIALLMVASLLKDRVTSKWTEIFFYDWTFVYDFFGPPQLAAFGNAMPLQGTGNSFWSICAEEQFYLLAPFLIVLVPFRAGKNILFWLIVAAIALAGPYWNYFGSISVGVLAAVIAGHIGRREPSHVFRVIAIFGAVGGLLSFAYFGLPYRAIAPFSAIATVISLAWSGPRSNFGEFVGGVSYPLYLNQWIGVFAANAVFERFGLRGTLSCKVAGVIISIIVCSLLYVLVDRLVRKHREKFFTDGRGKLIAFVAGSLVLVGVFGANYMF